MQFLFIGSRFTLHASFPQSVTLMQLRFSSLVVTNSRRDFHPQVCAHAGRTGFASLSGGAGEPPPCAPTEPYVRVSPHTALVVAPFGSLTVLAVLWAPPDCSVDQQIRLNDWPPSLHAHYRRFSTTTRPSAPVPRIGTQALAVLLLDAAPFASQRQVPTFHTKACAVFMLPICRMPTSQQPDSRWSCHAQQ